MNILKMSNKFSLEVLEVFHEPQNVSIFLGICHGKSFIREILTHVVILSVNLEGAVCRQVCRLYASIGHCFIGAARLCDEERYTDDNRQY